MKKVISTVVALALVSSITATASAVNNVWFQTNGAPVAGGAATCSGGPGAAGSTLSLGMDTTAGGGTCTWPIRLMLDYQGDGDDIGILAWALDLYTDSPTKVTAGNRSYGSPGFGAANEFNPNGPHPNGHAPLLTNSGRARTDGSSNPFGQYALMDFTITKTKAQGDTNNALIYVRIGNGAWGVDDPTFAQFAGKYKFGTNGVTDENGAADTVIPEAMILIDNTPEPATLSLLALGGLALIRRRR